MRLWGLPDCLFFSTVSSPSFFWQGTLRMWRQAAGENHRATSFVRKVLLGVSIVTPRRLAEKRIWKDFPLGTYQPGTLSENGGGRASITPQYYNCCS